jgi:hypothetical protein
MRPAQQAGSATDDAFKFIFASYVAAAPLCSYTGLRPDLSQQGLAQAIKRAGTTLSDD